MFALSHMSRQTLSTDYLIAHPFVRANLLPAQMSLEESSNDHEEDCGFWSAVALAP